VTATSENLASKAAAPARAEAALPRFPFAFALCRVGAEAAAKAELARLRPQYRPAFMRPGLLTWKCEPPLALDQTADALSAAVFLRSFGASLGAVHSVADLAQRLRALGDLGIGTRPALGLHVFAREGRDGDDRRDAETQDDDPRIAAVTAAVVTALPDLRLRPGPAQRSGELVIDVVLGPRRSDSVAAERCAQAEADAEAVARQRQQCRAG
jgi:hypothetical protein